MFWFRKIVAGLGGPATPNSPVVVWLDASLDGLVDHGRVKVDLVVTPEWGARRAVAEALLRRRGLMVVIERESGDRTLERVSASRAEVVHVVWTERHGSREFRVSPAGALRGVISP